MSIFLKTIMMKLSMSVVLLILFTMSAHGQTADNSLLSRKITLSISRGTFVYAIGRVAADYGVPVGLEKSSRHLDEERINLSVRDAPLKEVLDEIVKQDAGYRWQLIDGAINFIPIKNRNEFTAALLELPINPIDFADRNNSNSLRKGILQAPEVIVLMNGKGVDYSNFRDDMSTPLFTKGNGVASPSSLKVREILNRVVTGSESHITWVVEMVGEEKNKLLISF